MAEMADKVRDAMYEAAARDGESVPRRSYLGMSQIGCACLRKLWYGWRGYDASRMDGRMRMLFSLGDRVEEEVVRWLEAAGYSVRDRQLSFEAVNGHFRGHCDGIIEGVTSKPHILEVKSASASRWKMFLEKGVRAVSHEYWAQMQCYMRYSGLERALFVVMNKNDSSICTERVYYDEQAANALEAKARHIIYADSVPVPDDGPDCQFCGFRGHCTTPPYVQATKTCGTCSYLRCDETAGTWRCTNGKHAVQIVRWGLSCPDWTFADDVDEVPF